MKRPTSFDIAALAGVSQATVSRALSAASPVSEDVRRRVLEAAAKLNYVVDTNARKLRSKKINTIAVLVSQDLDNNDNRINPFFLPLIGSILAYADQKGIDVLMSLQNQGDDWGLDYGFARRADGIIFLGYRDFESYTQKIENLRRIGEPWVVFGPVMKDDPDLFVGSDNAGGAHAAVAHLLKKGRRRIVFLGEASEHHSEFFERYKGYLRAHIEAGVAPDRHLAVDCFISREEGAAAIDRLLEMHRRRSESDVRRLVLATRALTEVRKIGTVASQSRAVVDALIRCLELADTWVGLSFWDKETALALSTLPPHWSGRLRFLRWFHLRGQFREGDEHPGIMACVLYHGFELPWRISVHARSGTVRAWLLRFLTASCDSAAEIYDLLRDPVQKDPDSDVRHTALLLLAENGGDREDVRQLIWDRSRTDPAIGVRALALSLLGSVEDNAWQPIFETAEVGTHRDERLSALIAIAKYRGDDPRTWRVLRRRAVADPSELVREAALAGLYDTRAHKDDTWALIRDRAASDPQTRVRQRALRLLGGRPDDWEFIRGLVLSSKDSYIRSQALDVLTHLRGDDFDTWQLVRQRAVDDPNEHVRGNACRLLGLRKDDTDVEDFLRRRIAVESGEIARADALDALRDNCAHNEGVWGLARRLAVEDPSDGVRDTAITALCENRSEDPATWKLVFDRVRTDEHAFVREEAMRSMRHYPGDLSHPRNIFLERAYDDSDASVRARALLLLATDRGDEPATLDVIRDRAVADPAVRVRAAALRWWAVYEKGEAGAELLRGRAVDDPHPDARTVALQSLAYGWPAHPATAPLLRERAEADEDEDVRTEAARMLAAAEALAPLADQLP